MVVVIAVGTRGLHLVVEMHILMPNPSARESFLGPDGKVNALMARARPEPVGCGLTGRRPRPTANDADVQRLGRDDCELGGSKLATIEVKPVERAGQICRSQSLARNLELD